MTKETIQRLRESGMPILLVEQNAKLALSISNRACVFNHGRTVKDGNAADLIGDAEIQKLYLGI